MPAELYSAIDRSNKIDSSPLEPLTGYDFYIIGDTKNTNSFAGLIVKSDKKTPILPDGFDQFIWLFNFITDKDGYNQNSGAKMR